MKILAFFVNFFLALGIIVTTLLTIIDHTASASYIQSLATRTNTYQTLSQLLPAQISKQVNDNSDSNDQGGGNNTNNQNSGDNNSNNDAQQQQQTVSVITAVLTPAYLKTQLTSISTQFQTALKGNGTQVTIDLSAIAAEAQKQGIKMKDNQFKNVVIGSDKLSKPSKIVHAVELARMIALISTIALLLISIFLGFWRRIYHGLGRSLLISGIFEALIFIAVVIVPDKITANLSLSGSASDFSPLVHTLINQLALDLRLDFGLIASSLIVAGILLLVFGKHLPVRKGEEQPAPKAAKTPAPKPQAA